MAAPSRRELLASGTAFAIGNGWIFALLSHAAACVRAPPAAPPETGGVEAWRQTVDVVTDLILPQSDTPGAQAAGVTAFILELTASAEPDVRDKLLRGLGALDDRSKQVHGTRIADLTAAQREALLPPLFARLDALTTGVEPQRHLDGAFAVVPVVAWDKAGEDRAVLEALLSLKLLTVMGYLTSDVGRAALGVQYESQFHDDYAGCTHPDRHQG